jgi:hypothetical protein
MRVFFMRGGSLNLDTFYPIPVQPRVIAQIVSLFLIFQFSHFVKDRQLFNNISFFYRNIG